MALINPENNSAELDIPELKVLGAVPANSNKFDRIGTVSEVNKYNECLSHKQQQEHDSEQR